MELGINNWDSEIATLKKMKKFYTENELVDIIYQISIALEALQKRQLAHFNVEPKNIIVFKDKKYKINDFNEIKEVYNDDSNENNFNVNNLIPNENRFISPNLLDYFEKKCKKVDLVKNDVYSLGLCVMYSIKNDINLINKDFTMINNYNNNSGIINKNVENYFYYAEQLSKNHYSNKLKNLVKNMLNVNEHLRFDFTEIINDINEEYK
jgi:serine/threonine protein kinase